MLASEEAPGGTSTSTPMPLTGLAPWRWPQVAREPKLIWAAQPGNCQILVHKSEFWSSGAELRAMGSTVTVGLVAVSSTSEVRYPDLWTRVWQFPRALPEPRKKASPLAPRHLSEAQGAVQQWTWVLCCAGLCFGWMGGVLCWGHPPGPVASRRGGPPKIHKLGGKRMRGAGLARMVHGLVSPRR